MNNKKLEQTIADLMERMNAAREGSAEHLLRCENEGFQTCTLPCHALGEIPPDALVACDHDPVCCLSTEPSDPINVVGPLDETVVLHVADVPRLVTKRLDDSVERFREDGRCAAIEEKLQAAICCSNATARFTELCGTMNIFAACAVDPSALAARASTLVGTPVASSIGVPNCRPGSITMPLLRPSGYQRAAISF